MADVTKAAPQELTATLEEVVRRRADLHQAILGLERAAAAPAGGHEEHWQAGVIAALEEVEDEIVDHIEVTERDHGLYDEIIDVAPRLTRNIEVLRGEHPEMQAATSALRARLASAPVRGDDAVAEARHAIEHVLAQLVSHRRRGADLLWEAYSLDTGGGE
jgi:chromosome condensin MukBEF complex kleisin-like MukF subunit